MKKVFKIIISIFCVAIIFLNLILILKSIIFTKQVPSLFNYKGYIVKSSSSQTDLEYGEFVLIKDEDDIKVDDIVVVKTGDKKATTYSVKTVDKDMLKLENESKDYVSLSKKSIEGKVIYKSSFLGNIIEMLKNPIVIIFSIVITSIIGICIYKF